MPVIHSPRSKHTVLRYADLAALPDHYEAVFSCAARTSLFFTRQWYRNFIGTVLAPHEHLRIYAVGTTSNPPQARAVLPMRYSNPRAGVFGIATLSGLSNYYTSLFGPVVDSDESALQDVLDSLAAAIASDKMHWDAVNVHPLAAGEPVFPGLVAAFRNAGLLVQTYFCFGNWYLQIRGRSYAEYFESLPPQVRSTVKRKRKQLEKSPDSRIVIYSDMASIDEGVRAYEQIYAASWKVPEPHPGFIRGLCHTCAESGWLRLGVVYVDGQAVAAQIWIVVSGVANIYKLAYDERFAKLSAGSVLTAHLMEHVIDVDRVHEVDYLTGDDAYKKDWMSDRRERWGIMAFNPRTPKGLILALRHLGARAMKRAVDRVRRIGAART